MNSLVKRSALSSEHCRDGCLQKYDAGEYSTPLFPRGLHHLKFSLRIAHAKSRGESAAPTRRRDFQPLFACWHDLQPKGWQRITSNRIWFVDDPASRENTNTTLILATRTRESMVGVAPVPARDARVLPPTQNLVEPRPVNNFDRYRSGNPSPSCLVCHSRRRDGGRDSNLRQT